MGKYPFRTSEEIKKQVSGVDSGFEDVNIESGKRRAASHIKDIVSAGVYNLTMEHYEGDNYNIGGQEDEQYLRLDLLVDHVQFAMAHFTFFYHFVWLQLRIANDTISLTDKENAPYKYQEDAAKEELLETAYEGVNDLIDFLDQESTKWTVWAASTVYKAGDIIKYEEKYYTASAGHTSSQDFATDAPNWEETGPDNIIFKEWTSSGQYAAQQNQLFNGYKEFDTYFGINRSAAFYVKAATIINEVIEDDIVPRTGDISGVKVRGDERLSKKIKKYVAYRTMSVAAIRMDYFSLPESLRKDVGNEYKQKSLTSEKTMREKTAQVIGNQAKGYLEEIDLYLAQKDKTPAERPYNKFKSKLTNNDKHCSIGI